MRIAMRRLRRLEGKRNQNRRVEWWILFDDGRVQNLITGQLGRVEDLSDNEYGPIPFFISEADARA